jgi:SAM-dependent methyltransferase
MIKDISRVLQRRAFGLQTRVERLRHRVFDIRYGTETAREIPLSATGLTEAQWMAANTVYRPFWSREFTRAVRAAGINFSEFSFVDVGSGKGKVLLLASRFPFFRVIGIEFARGLHDIAARNVRAFSRSRKACPIELVWGDALSCELPTGPTMYFLFNPFDAAVTERFLDRLEAHSRGRRTVVVYANIRSVLERASEFSRLRSFRCLASSNRWIVFSNFQEQSAGAPRRRRYLTHRVSLSTPRPAQPVIGHDTANDPGTARNA